MINVPTAERRSYKNLGEFAYHQLKTEILSGQYAPGSVVSELKISERLEISRTPVKNALYKLAMDGLVEVIPNKGYVVREYSIKEIIEITQAREVIEGLAAKLACERLKPDDLAYIRTLFPETEPDVPPEITEEIREDGEKLHRLLILKSGNSVIADLLSRFANQIAQTSAMVSMLPDRKAEAYYEHIKLARALLARDAAGAEACMREHLANQRLALLKGLLF